MRHETTGSIPYCEVFDERIDLSKWRVFGTKAWSVIPKQHRDNKLSDVSELGYIVGIDKNAYHLYFPHKRNILRRKHVKVDETPPTDEDLEELTPSDILQLESESFSDDDDEPLESPDDIDQEESDQEHPPESQEELTPSLRQPSTRTRSVPLRFREVNSLQSRNLEDQPDQEPLTLKQALRGPHADEWKQAVDSEFRSLQEMGTWTLVDPPKNRKIISCKWVFKIKRGKDNEILRYKARLVARGFTQREGIDYNDVFSPVIRFDTLRIMISIALYHDINLLQLDIETAFLHGNLEEELYMKQPPGYEQPGKVCKLKKSIYGLKQASRILYQNVDKLLTSNGYHRNGYDPCMYSKRTPGHLTIVGVYVDDVVYGSTDPSEVTRFESIMQNTFTTKLLGDVSLLLGIVISRDEDGNYTMHQKPYIDRMVERFHLENANPLPHPIFGEHLQKRKPDEEVVHDLNLYQQLVGSLLYSRHTRPEISYALGQLARFMQDASVVHWKAAKQVLRYLKGTADRVLRFRKTKHLKIEAHGDADFANDTDDRKSVTGMLVKLGGNPIIWSSKKQPIVTESTTQAEYVQMAHTCREVLWIRGILEDMGYTHSTPSVVYQDNQSAITLAQDNVHRPRTKHVDISYHATRDHVRRGKIKLVYCNTNEMIADGLTKPLTGKKFKTFAEQLYARTSSFQGRVSHIPHPRQ